MKKGTWIIVATLFSIGAIVGASALTHTSDSMKQELSAEEQIKAAPKEALDSATIDLKQALARHDAPAVIASLMKQSAARLLIDRDTLPAIIGQNRWPTVRKTPSSRVCCASSRPGCTTST